MAILTHDTDRFAAFYREVFDAEIGSHLEEFDGAVQLTFIRIGQTAELNVFRVAGNTEADRQSPMFGRGRIDHLGLQAASLDAFDQIRDRLIARAPVITSSPISVRPQHLLPGPGRPRG